VLKAWVPLGFEESVATLTRLGRHREARTL